MEYFDSLTNPFLIDVPEQHDYTPDELREIQLQLDAKSLPFSACLGGLHTGTAVALDACIEKRCCRGLRQQLVGDPSTTPLVKELRKIGEGGPHCVVSCVPLGAYEGFLASLYDSLVEVGFNGYFYQRQGGFPTPTGTEMRYAGVPYSFKIFLMLEAQKLGFDHVLWVDAACSAVSSPEPLFRALHEKPTVFRWFAHDCFEENRCERYMFPRTCELLSQLVARDIRRDRTVVSIVFGLNMASPTALKFIEEYYRMVELGLPFLSCFPEESVFAAILNRPEHEHVFDAYWSNLYVHECYIGADEARRHGFYFLQRHHTGGG
jgi:hypothetical protein